jgi:hypothetical protein
MKNPLKRKFKLEDKLPKEPPKHFCVYEKDRQIYVGTVQMSEGMNQMFKEIGDHHSITYGWVELGSMLKDKKDMYSLMAYLNDAFRTGVRYAQGKHFRIEIIPSEECPYHFPAQEYVDKIVDKNASKSTKS